MNRRNFFPMIAAGIFKGKFNDTFTAELGNGFDTDTGIRTDDTSFCIGDKFD